MLETVDLKASLDPQDYKPLREQLRIQLSEAQHQAWQNHLGVVVVLEGWSFSGKAHCMRFLSEAMDPRGLSVYMMYPPSREERQYPFARRYALRMPARGQIALFVRSWYYHVLEERILLEDDALVSQVAFEEIRSFEKAMADDGYLLIKLWLHISRKEQLRRRQEFREGGMRRFRTGPDDPRQHKRWKEYTRVVEEMLAATSTEDARWYPVSANDHRLAQVTVARTVVQLIEQRLAWRSSLAAAPAPNPNGLPSTIEPAGVPQGKTVLGSVDLSRALPSTSEYEERLTEAQQTLNELQYQCLDQGRAVAFCFEGWDAAGKGGIIQRLTSQLDPRYFHVQPVGTPRGEEAEHHYLWRFWRHIPPSGHWTIFDRTWYGRVLVERVEGLASYAEWQRAYREIRHFEMTLVRTGTILLKFWLHISREEQLRRFQERQGVPYKNYKITEEDWRNRDRWPQYEIAVEEMLERTSTLDAPWHVIPANDKQYARVTVLETSIEAIQKGLKHKGSPLLKRFNLATRKKK